MNSVAIPLNRDVQSEVDARGMPIDKVGINGLRYPLSYQQRDGERQEVVAECSLGVSLPADQRGTHMSRFVQGIEGFNEALTPFSLACLLDALRENLSAPRVTGEVDFTFFRSRTAPVTGLVSKLGYECVIAATSTDEGREFMLKVRVPVTTLCPCSRAISDYGAHNQRGYVTIKAGFRSQLWLEDLIDVAEASGSAEIYPLLKRADERKVTMRAYETPVFVEDIVRIVATSLKGDPRILWFEVEAENQESIHDHSAVAALRWERPE